MNLPEYQLGKPEKATLIDLPAVIPLPTLIHEWPRGLSADIALNTLAVGSAIVDDADLCKQYDLTKEELEGIKVHPAFKIEVRESIALVKDSYATIKRKARMQFEYYMDTTLPSIILDSSGNVSADTRLKAIQYLGKVMGLDAAEKAAENAAQSEADKGKGSGPSINIILTQSPTTQTAVTVAPNLERLD